MAILILFLFSIHIQNIVNNRRRIEHLLRDSATKFENMVEGMSDLAFRLDTMGHIVYMNSVSKRWLGYQPEKFISTSLSAIMPESQKKLLKRALKAVVSGNRVKNLRSEVNHRDGQVFPIEVSAVPVYDDTGEIIGVQGVMKDVSGQKFLENPLKKCELRFIQVLEAVPDAVLMVDKTESICYSNSAVETLFRQKRDVLCRRSFPFPLEGNKFNQLKITLEDDDNVFVKVDAIEIKWDDKQVHLVFLRDMREVKKGEKYLMDANGKIDAFEQKQNKLLSKVFHKLRVPIAAVQEGITICLDGLLGDLSEQHEDILNNALMDTERIVRLITDLLDILRIEMDRVNLRKMRVDLCQVIHDLVSDLAGSAETKAVRMKAKIPKKKLSVYTDPEKINTLLKHIFRNSLKFSPDHSEVIIQLEEKDKLIQLNVTDHGIGIEKKDLSRIFNKLEQLGTVKGDIEKGAGLGLAIVKGLADKLGVKIQVDSVLGKGTTFSFYFEKASIPKILIADDKPSKGEAISKYLGKHDYQAIHACDGIEAIHLAQNEQPNIIVLSRLLSKLDGYEVITRLRRNTSTEDIPIIIHGSDNGDSYGRAPHNSDRKTMFLKKPYKLEELKMQVDNFLSEGLPQ